MSEIQIVDLREIFLSNSSFGPHEIEEIKNEISGNYAQFAVLKEVIAEMAMMTERTPASSSCQVTLPTVQLSNDTSRPAPSLHPSLACLLCRAASYTGIF